MSNEARESEAAGNTITVKFRGESFVVPTEYVDYPLAFIEAVGDDKPAAIQLRELLGPEQWEKVRAMGCTGRDINELTNLVSDARGIDAGNSPASSD
jgi:hypothetical protein